MLLPKGKYIKAFVSVNTNAIPLLPTLKVFLLLQQLFYIKFDFKKTPPWSFNKCASMNGI
jgi:hypothetical protein